MTCVSVLRLQDVSANVPERRRDGQGQSPVGVLRRDARLVRRAAAVAVPPEGDAHAAQPEPARPRGRRVPSRPDQLVLQETDDRDEHRQRMPALRLAGGARQPVERIRQGGPAFFKGRCGLFGPAAMNAVRPAGVLGPTRPSSQAQRPAFDYGAVLLQCLLVSLFPLYVHVVGGGQSIWHPHLDWGKQRSRTKSSSLSVDFVTRPRSQCQEERQKRHNYYRGPVALSKPAVRKRYAATVSHALSGVGTTTESHSVDKLWTCYKSALDTAARDVVGPRRQAKQPWISQVTQSVIEQQRKAVLAGDVEEYKRLAGHRHRTLRHDKQLWAERIALEGEQCLCSGEIKDDFTSFRQLIDY